MYSTNGDFGQVRLATLLTPLQNPHLFTLHNIGWHRCNDRYHIARPQGNDLHLLLFTVKGKGILELQGQEHTLLPGTIAFVPRDMANSYYTPAGGMWEFYWIHPTGGAAVHFLDELTKKSNFLTQFEPGYRYQQRLEEIYALCAERPQEFEWHLSQKLSELLHHLAVTLCGKPAMPALSRRAITYMERNFQHNVSLDEVAQMLFVSTAHLIRVFKKETGRTPHQYLTQYRLIIAAQLLEFSDQRIEEIAVQTGFSSASHFISHFKSLYGCTPLQYREQVSVMQSADE